MQGTEYGPHATGYEANSVDVENFLYFRRVVLKESLGTRRAEDLLWKKRDDLHDTDQAFRTHFNCRASDENGEFSEKEFFFREAVEEKFNGIRDELLGVSKQLLGEHERFNVREACDECLQILAKRKQEYDDILSRPEDEGIEALSEAKIMHPALVEAETMMTLFRDLAERQTYLTANDLWELEKFPTSELSVDTVQTFLQQSEEDIIDVKAAEALTHG